MTASPPERPRWRTRTSRVVYDNPWIEVSHREVVAPTGNDGIYGLVHFRNLAIGVVPIDDEGHTWLVGQHRYTLDAWSWEIPEGGGAHHIDPVDSARRELAEETGLLAGSIRPLLEMHTSNSVTDERAIVYVATDLSPGPVSDALRPDDTEALEVCRLPLAEAIDMVLRDEITDSMSMAALLKLDTLGRRGEIRW